MKITQDRLRQIIKEELEEVLSEKNKNTDDDTDTDDDDDDDGAVEYFRAMEEMPMSDWPPPTDDELDDYEKKYNLRKK